MKILARFGALAFCLAALHSYGQPVTALWYQSQPGEFVGAGETHLVPSPANAFDLPPSLPPRGDTIEVRINGSEYRLAINAPRGTVLTADAYEPAVRHPVFVSAGIGFSAGGRSCGSPGGRFVILELARNPDESIQRLAVNFEQRCTESSPNAPRLYGELRFNSEIPFTFDRPAGWTTPDAFSFRPRDALFPPVEVTSNEITVYGIKAIAPISVSDGAYSINGGPFTAAAGSVSNLDRVRVRRSASPTPGATVAATLTIGGVSSSLQLTTFVPGQPLTGFYFRAAPGENLAPGETHFGSVINAWVQAFPEDLQFTIPAENSGLRSLLLATARVQAPPIGSYVFANDPVGNGAPAWPDGPAGTGCPAVPGPFVVVDTDSNPIFVNRIGVDFEHRCVGGTASLHGEFRVNSAVPFGMASPPPAPTIGAVVPGIELIYVLFTPPASDGGTPILEYEATCGNRSATGAGSFIQVYGITTGMPTTCTVRARNAVGFGAASVASAAVIPGTIPDAPTIGVATAGSGSVRLTFTPPAHDGGRTIQMYDARCGTSAGGATSSPVVVRGLTPGVPVTCTVRAVNVAGFGPYSAPSNPVAPLPAETLGVDFNGDGRADLVFQDATGNIGAWTMNGTGVFNAIGLLPAGSGWSITHTADFDGDGKADVLLRHTDGRVLMWLMNGLSVTGQFPLQAAGSGWKVTHTADMNGDGKADILWERDDGAVAAWTMDGAIVTNTRSLQPEHGGWHITHMADLNGDHKADILWQHTDGTTVAWIMDGLTYVSSAGFTPAGSGWSITATGDVNGDGKADLVFTKNDGAIMLWIMNGTSLLDFAALQNAGTPWRLDLVGDLDGDGKADLVWRNTRFGSTYATLMNGTVTLSAGYLMGEGSGWTATHLRDLNGDGKMDILWRYTDGTLATWIMNGLAPTGAAGLIGPSTWQVVPAP